MTLSKLTAPPHQFGFGTKRARKLAGVEFLKHPRTGTGLAVIQDGAASEVSGRNQRICVEQRDEHWQAAIRGIKIHHNGEIVGRLGGSGTDYSGKTGTGLSHAVDGGGDVGGSQRRAVFLPGHAFAELERPLATVRIGAPLSGEAGGPRYFRRCLSQRGIQSFERVSSRCRNRAC